MKIHIVQKGDTLWNIAQKYGVDFEQLKKMNGHLSNPDMIMPGMKVKVPTGGVPVKKEIQKKETKINIAPKKEAPSIEHPYAEGKPFVSFEIEAEVNNVSSKKEINIKPPAKETPKAPIAEVPKEIPKEIPKEVPKEAPKEVQKEVEKEVPKPTVPEMNKAPEKDLEKVKNIAPLTHTIPPVSPQANVNLSNQIPNIPPIPPKPANILPDIMKPEIDLESPVEPKVEKDISNEQPPELTKIPYVPVMPQQTFPDYGMPVQPNVQAQEPPCVPVTPVMPGPGFYYQPMPMAPVSYPSYPQPQVPFHVESGSHPFPGIHESGNEAYESLPPMPNVAAPNVNAEAAENVAPQMMSNIPMPQAPSNIPMPCAPCVPIAPVMPGYGWCPPAYPQPYMPATSAYYPPAYQVQPIQTGVPMQATEAAPFYPPAQAPMQPAHYPPAQAPIQPSYYPPAQPSAFPPTSQQLFMMPEYRESSEYEK